MRSRSRRKPVGAAALSLLTVAALAAATGCGGSSEVTATSRGPSTVSSIPSTVKAAAPTKSPSTTTASPPSQHSAATAPFVASADAICKRFNARLGASKPTGTDARGLASNALVHARLEQETVTQLNKLTPPSPLAGDWRQIVAYKQTLAAELVELSRARGTNDTAGIKSLAASKRRNHLKLFELASRDGFKECSQPDLIPHAARS